MTASVPEMLADRSTQGALGHALRILMRRHGVSVEDAFELLLRASRRSGAELSEVAAQIVSADRVAQLPARRYRVQRAFSRSGPRSVTYWAPQRSAA